MDALFGLCRKKSSGTSVRPPLFNSTFFKDQDNVDEHVAGYSVSDRVIDKVPHLLIACEQVATMYVDINFVQGCHEFLAGDALRSKSRFSTLDETGVFGSICKHEFPQRFLNLKHGERYDCV